MDELSKLFFRLYADSLHFPLRKVPGDVLPLYQVSNESFQQEKDPQKFSIDGNEITCALRFSFNFCLSLSDSIVIEIWSPRGTRFNLVIIPYQEFCEKGSNFEPCKFSTTDS